MLETSRIIGISMASLADANRDMVGEVFTEPGIDERELAMRYAAAAETMPPLLGETLLHAYRIHLREAIRQAVITEAELAEGRLAGSDDVTIAFADLVGFTSLGESLEIEQIGQLTGRLFELASEAARPPVRLVKMIGDAAMFASREPVPLMDAVVGLVDAAGTEEMPSLKAGVATGPALGRGGDWYGRPVNLAARITSVRPPRQRPGRPVRKGLAASPRTETGSGFHSPAGAVSKGSARRRPCTGCGPRSRTARRVNPRVTTRRNAFEISESGSRWHC